MTRISKIKILRPKQNQGQRNAYLFNGISIIHQYIFLFISNLMTKLKANYVTLGDIINLQQVCHPYYL